MGTRSRIGIMHGDVCKSVYVHWDGYLSGVGAMLLEHYSDSPKVNRLIAGGDFSSLESDPIDISYYAHRGEENTEYISTHSFEEFFELAAWGEFYYIMQDGVWYCGSIHPNEKAIHKKLVPLTNELIKQSEEEEVD